MSLSSRERAEISELVATKIAEALAPVVNTVAVLNEAVETIYVDLGAEPTADAPTDSTERDDSDD